MSDIKYQNWNPMSRWESTKQYSKWHFDPSRPPQLGKDSYTYVGRFDYDFTDIVKECIPKSNAKSWASRNKHKVPGELWTASAEEQDLIRAGANPEMEIFDRYTHADRDVMLFRFMGDMLGLQFIDTNFHNQTTGQMLVEHLDNFPAINPRNNDARVTEYDENPDLMRRFTIMLADWQLGQVFQLGNANWTQWRAGDCITWEWQDIPHATCNMGWWDRPMLQITGCTTPMTQQILDNAGPNQIFDLSVFK
jgi:hypothetical protein